MKNQKLELTWVNKDVRPRLEPRVLLPDETKSYVAEHRVTEQDIFDNKLIFGDNLLALKALEQELTGKVKCVFIDPPYNTGSAFEHYDDGLEHSLWLTMMRDRLELLRTMLSDDGSIWITLDDTEMYHLKLLCDECFGRKNFLGNVIWEKSDSPRMDAHVFSLRHDYILVYAKNIDAFQINRIESDEVPSHYDRIDADGRQYYLKPLRAMGGQGDSRAARPSLYYPLEAPDKTLVYPKKQDGSDGAWRWSKEKAEAEIERIDWVEGRNGWTPYYRIYADTTSARPAETIWTHTEVGSNRTSKAEIKRLFPDSIPFDTPKPERLLQKIIQLATNSGDIVLDSFAGSGTTGAVAHKMGRKWVMVELQETAHTHIIPRLRKVIDGTDAGGISESVGWKGGGGFRYYTLAPSLLEKDKWDNWVISPKFNAAMLSEAICKLEGFTYAPSPVWYWLHGQSTERDYIYVTTQHLSLEQLQSISDEVGSERTLLIMCNAYRADPEMFPNLTIKKIPQSVLHKCEWGKDDYSLKVENLPKAEVQPEVTTQRRKPTNPNQQSLFSGGDD